MILPFTTYDNVISNWYSFILNQSALPVGRVLNKDSVNGVDLYKLISQTEINSIELSDAFILFEVIESPEEDINYTTTDNENVDLITTYTLRLNIYGNRSHTMAQNILGRLKTNEMLLSLRDSGIFVTNVSFPTLVREFINDLLWDRCDLSIKFVCRFEISKLHPGGNFNENSLNGLHIDVV